MAREAEKELARIAATVERGVSIVCATCTHYRRGAERAQKGGSVECGKPSCGGPLRGRDFPDYNGPMTPEAFETFCFVCGVLSDYGVRVPEGRKTLSVCASHLEVLAHLRSVHHDPSRPVNLEVIGASQTDPRKLFPHRKTISQAIYEVEKYYADKEGREL